MHYTPTQTRWFLRAIGEHAAAERLHAFIDARLVQDANGDAFKQHLAALKQDAAGTP